VDLLTENASRNEAKASRLTFVKNCRPFAARQRSNVKCLDATPLPLPIRSSATLHVKSPDRESISSLDATPYPSVFRLELVENVTAAFEQRAAVAPDAYLLLNQRSRTLLTPRVRH